MNSQACGGISVKISDLKKRAEARESGVARDILIWGGLRKVKDSSITGNLVADLIDTPKENARVRVATSFGRSVLKDSRLASWTKILAMRYPKDFFIFDSRVSNALNKLLCSSSLNGKLAEAGVRCFFPSLPAQSTTGMLAAEQKANIDALKGKEKHMKPFSDCAVLYFDLYCPLIKKLARRLYEDPEVNTVPLEEVFRPYLVGLDENFRKETLPHLVEMALFMYGKPEGKSCGCQRKVNPD